MKNRELDSRVKEDLIRQIASRAEVYTPEWKFDKEHPDAGTALALIFADQFANLIRRYNRIPEKHETEFFDFMGLKLLSSIPASGYVTFGLSSEEFGGAEIPKGTIVLGPGGAENAGDVFYETTEELYVTPSKLLYAFLMDGKEDFIGKKEVSRRFAPFLPEEENLQEHVLYLCQNEVLDMKSQGAIRLELKAYRLQERQSDDFWMMDKEVCSVSYGTENGFEEFESRSLEMGSLLLGRGKNQPNFYKKELFGKEGYWICCRILGAWKKEPFLVEDIRLAAKAVDIEPDFIYTESGEQKNIEIFPFGESPAPFREFYFASEEVFGKAGAQVQISFCLDYERIPFDESFLPDRNWKLLMKRSDFKPDPEFDITIEQVIWEYYNGSGWSRLPSGSMYETIFRGGNAAEDKEITLTFTCPADAALLTWQSEPSRYIRVRILKMNNLYKPKGAYITPVISKIRLCYSYMGRGRHPQFAAVSNNREQTIFPVKELEQGAVCWEVFKGPGRQERSLYLGFSRPLDRGPLKLFCSLEESMKDELPHLTFEYSGRKGFHPLTVFDETKQMRRSGCLTFLGEEDCEAYAICGVTAYWIRITDEKGGYRRVKELPKVPEIDGIFLNTTKIMAVENRPAEFFQIEPKEEHKVCTLRRGNIHTLEVWVNEINGVSDKQRKELKKERQLEEEYDRDGCLSGLWVRWEETEDFCLSGPGDRHYVLDRNLGTVAFSDGKYGAIPPAAAGETIRIRYSCGGGEEGNQVTGAIDRVDGSYGYVNRVANPGPVCGGCGQERITEALRRGKMAMRHMGRAVTDSDYEALAYEASRFVERARCFSNYNEKGVYTPGCITLVLLLKEYQSGNLYFENIKEEVLTYLSSRMDGNRVNLGQLCIVEPQFLELDCYTRVVVSDFNSVFEVQREIEERLREFINPVTGNYHGGGWEIGEIPNETQIMNTLKGTKGLLYLREIRMTPFIKTRRGRVEVQLPARNQKAGPGRTEEERVRFAVGLCGTNKIVVHAE